MKNLVLSCVVVLAGCAVNAASPHPNIDFPQRSSKSISLLLADSIPDSQSLGAHDQIVGVQINDWHKTLTQGFQNGFGPGFTPKPSAATDLTVKLNRADLRFVPVGGTGNTLIIVAQITYDAQLVDKSGAVMKTSARTVNAKAPMTQAIGMNTTGNASSAVEAMYEGMAKDLFP
jgi:hypothetical protein